MRIEVLYFDGCPTYRAEEEALRGVLAQEGARAEVELVAVNTDKEAQRPRFPGSPTIRADGKDLFPSEATDRAGYALGCRMYATPEGLRGSPTAEMIEEAPKTSEDALQKCPVPMRQGFLSGIADSKPCVPTFSAKLQLAENAADNNKQVVK